LFQRTAVAFIPDETWELEETWISDVEVVHAQLYLTILMASYASIYFGTA
jgi:hypothetical protein